MSQKAEQKQKSHDAILASAAALLLERGIRASSVMDVMKGAGLTVGGFYGHFESKEQLFTEVIRNSARAMWGGLLQRAMSDTSRSPVMSVLERYLSRKHRDNAEVGCPLPSITSEVAREGEPYRDVLEGELSGFIHSLGELIGPGEKSREKALALMALMYGALSLARAVHGTRLSDEFLEAAKKFGAQALNDGPASSESR